MEINKAVEILRSSKEILILAGAGMSADHGTPVFQGVDGQYTEGVDKYCKGVYDSIECLASPDALFEHPELFWRFYRDRKVALEDLYPNVHSGYVELLEILRNEFSLGKSIGIITTNTDAAFYAANYEFPILEVHGTIEFQQCIRDFCRSVPWRASSENFNSSAKCPVCTAKVRPNIQMFGDFTYVRNDQNKRNEYLANFSGKDKTGTAVLLVGAGGTIPTLNIMASRLVRAGAKVIVLNPAIPKFLGVEQLDNLVNLEMKAMEGIGRIAAQYRKVIK